MDNSCSTRNRVELGSGSCNVQCIRIGQWNSQSLAPKKLELEILLNQEKISICVLSETWLDYDTNLRINGYNIYRNDRDDGYGGVAIVIHHSIKAQIYPIYLRNTGIQILCVEILNCKYIKYIASIYCPSSITTTQYDWDEVFSKFQERSIIAGDFNGHHSNWSNKINGRGLQIQESSLDNNFVSLNSGDLTRIKLVDGVLQESAPDVTFVTTDIAIYFKTWLVTKENLGSDHLFIKYFLEYNDMPSYVKRRNFKLADWQLYHNTCLNIFSNNVVMVNFDHNAQAMYNFFVETVNSATEQSIPYRKICTSPLQKFKPKHYWCPALSQAVAKRRLALKYFRRNPTPNNLDVLNGYISEAQKAIKQAKSNSWKRFCGGIDAATSSSDIWRKMRWMKGVRENRFYAPDDKKEQLLRSLTPDFVQPPPPIFASKNSQLESEFTPQELYNCLNKKDTSPGEDNITYLLYGIQSACRIKDVSTQNI